MLLVLWLYLCLAAGVFALAGLAFWSWLTARAMERAVPPQGRFIEIDGRRLHYLDMGEPAGGGAGPALVFVHGLNGQMGNFLYALAGPLARDHRVLLIDRPGSGYSDFWPSAHIADQARVVGQFIALMGLEKPLIVGHSLGGAIALRLALDRPDAICGAALIAPLTHYANVKTPPPFRFLSLRSPALRRLFAWTLALPFAIFNTPAVFYYIFGPQRTPLDFGKRGGGLLTLRPKNYIAAARDFGVVEADIPAQEARYGDLKKPVSVLFGKQDRILDFDGNGVALQKRSPQVELTLMEGGHMLPVTSPVRPKPLFAPR